MKTWILLAFAVCAARGCPKDVTSAVDECMEPLGSQSVGQGQILEFMSRLDKTTQLCSEGKIQRTISCLHELYNSCARHKGSSHKHDFGLLVNAGKWREAMDTICNNIEYFQDNAECEKNASLEYIPCAKAQVDWANQNYIVINKQKHATEHHKMNESMKIGCLLTSKIMDCLKKPFKKFCPDKLTNILVSTVESFRPPMCSRKYHYNGNHGHTNSVNISITTSEIKPPTSGNLNPPNVKHSRFQGNSSPILKADSGKAIFGLILVTLLVLI